MEQVAAYNASNQSLAIIGAENSTVHSIAVPAFACPSDPASGVRSDLSPGALSAYGVPDPAHMVRTSYAGMIGSLPVLAQPLPSTNCAVPGALVAQCNGVFNDLAPIRLAAVTDGLSNTIFMAEKATTLLQSASAFDPRFAAQHGWYITGNWGDTLVTRLYPPNACDKVAAVTAWSNSASSMHPDGLNVLRGDGSVPFIKDSRSSLPGVKTSFHAGWTRRRGPPKCVTGSPGGAHGSGDEKRSITRATGRQDFVAPAFASEGPSPQPSPAGRGNQYGIGSQQMPREIGVHQTPGSSKPLRGGRVPQQPWGRHPVEYCVAF
jgi:Protein of unknown function (DUF1559)